MPALRGAWLKGSGVILLVALASGIIFLTRPAVPPGMEGNPGQPASAIKLMIEADGLYRLTLDQLRSTGLALDTLEPSELSLTLDGQSVPYVVRGDGLVFYGRSPDNRYAPYRAYILESGSAGVIMATVSAEAALDDALSGPAVRTLYLEENLIYDGRTQQRGTDLATSDPWYWLVLQPGSESTIEFELKQLPQGPAQLELGLNGVTHDTRVEPDHVLELHLNGSQLEPARWDGPVDHVHVADVPEGVLRLGLNVLVLDNTVGEATVDISQLDWLKVVYAADPVGADDYLEAQAEAGTLMLTGFSERPDVFDISDPDQPALLEGTAAGATGLGIRVLAVTTLAAAAGPGYLEPAGVQPVRQGILNRTDNQADLIIVTTDVLAPALAALVEARKSQGLEVVVSITEEIYDSFGFGQPVPGSLQQFVRFAYQEWAPPRPTYLLLVGSASHDYRGYLGPGPANPVPAPMVAVNFGGETVSDARLADVNGDLSPDLAVGRLPVDDPLQLEQLVSRTLAYEQDLASRLALFAADGTEARFGVLSDDLIRTSSLESDTVSRLYGADAAQFASAWRDGAWMVVYTGHGSIERWGKEDIFSTDDVESISSNAAPPIVLQLTCLTGYFAHPRVRSLSEEMLLHPEGPVGVFAASSLTLSSDQLPFGRRLIAALSDPSVVRIGDALQSAKLPLDVANDEGLREVSDTFGLFGDPTLVINRPYSGGTP
jgi:hypothetical protein